MFLHRASRGGIRNWGTQRQALQNYFTWNHLSEANSALSYSPVTCPTNRKDHPMASRAVVLLTDDTDGSKADLTVRFGLDGTEYEIDLSEANAKKLHGALDPWMQAARKTGGRAGRRRSETNGSVDVKAIREWAKKQGMNVSERGRVSAEVRQAYDKAVKG